MFCFFFTICARSAIIVRCILVGLDFVFDNFERIRSGQLELKSMKQFN